MNAASAWMDRKKTRGAVPWVWVFFFLSLLCLCVGLDRGFILDEYKTWMDCLLPFRDLVADRMESGHFPTYFLLVKWWSGLVGTNEWALRVPSVAMTAVTVFPLYLLIRNIYGRGTALVAVALFCPHQLVLWIGQAARPYAGLLLFSVTGAWGCLCWWETGKSRWLWILGGSVMGSVGFMPLGALSFIAFVCALLTRVKKNPGRAVPALAAIVIPLLVMAGPAWYLGHSQEKLGVTGTHSTFRPLKGINGITDLAFGNFRLWGPGRVGNLSALLALFLLWGFFRRIPGRAMETDGAGGSGNDFPARAMLLLWFFLPALILAIAQAVSGKNLMAQERYYAPSLAGILVVFARGTAGLFAWRRWAGWVAAIGLAGLMIPTTVAWWRDPGEGPRKVAAEMIHAAGGTPHAVAGHVRWLRYELHGSVPDRELFLERGDRSRVDRLMTCFQIPGDPRPVMYYDTHGGLTGELRTKIVDWAAGRPFWLFVYLNKKDALDGFWKNPPAGFRLEKKFRFRDARAGWFVPEQEGLSQ